ncbi:hypothetical protein LVJ77_05445 [Conchiformibius kuhniae]|uniref:Uncharacterized protein n=1 Tax=Conchiformibius kuhniae TaxID=211502 RepID=A0A8T9MWM3_9NEIS|nr:hypothetical protein LVJ77_05445 [Conchiformibius kuhniae]
MDNQTQVWISKILGWAEHFYIGNGYPHVDYKRKFILEHKRHNAQVVNSDVVFTAEEEAELQHLWSLSEQAWGEASDLHGMAILPDKLWTSDVNTPAPDLSAFTITGNHLVLSEACGEIFQQFHLGNSKLVKLQIYNMGTLEPDDERFFYFFDLAEWRHYVLPEKSGSACDALGYERNGYKYHFYRPNKDSLVLSEAALNCDLDIWHDPMLMRSVFLSKRLYQALDDAGMIKDWHVNPCLID